MDFLKINLLKAKPASESASFYLSTSLVFLISSNQVPIFSQNFSYWMWYVEAPNDLRDAPHIYALTASPLEPRFKVTIDLPKGDCSNNQAWPMRSVGAPLSGGWYVPSEPLAGNFKSCLFSMAELKMEDHFYGILRLNSTTDGKSL